jgi:hypothetical protein
LRGARFAHLGIILLTNYQINAIEAIPDPVACSGRLGISRAGPLFSSGMPPTVENSRSEEAPPACYFAANNSKKQRAVPKKGRLEAIGGTSLLTPVANSGKPNAA